jgi:hypothetical protein
MSACFPCRGPDPGSAELSGSSFVFQHLLHLEVRPPLLAQAALLLVRQSVAPRHGHSSQRQRRRRCYPTQPADRPRIQLMPQLAPTGLSRPFLAAVAIRRAGRLASS